MRNPQSDGYYAVQASADLGECREDDVQADVGCIGSDFSSACECVLAKVQDNGPDAQKPKSEKNKNKTEAKAVGKWVPKATAADEEDHQQAGRKKNSQETGGPAAQDSPEDKQPAGKKKKSKNVRNLGARESLGGYQAEDEQLGQQKKKKKNKAKTVSSLIVHETSSEDLPSKSRRS